MITLFLSNGFSPSDRGLTFANSVKDACMIEMNCAGNLISNAKQTPLVNTGNGIDFAKIIIIARYIDASNFCLILPPLPNNGLNEIELYGVSPNNITAFIPNFSGTFLNGSNNVILNNAQGKLIRNTPFGWTLN